MSYRQPVKKQTLLSRITRSVSKSDVFMPAFLIGLFVEIASDSFTWGMVAGLAMVFVLGEIANLKDEIRRRD